MQLGKHMLLINPEREGEGAWCRLRVRYINGHDVAAMLPIDGHGGATCYSCEHRVYDGCYPTG
jgi:hypothetical protein